MAQGPVAARRGEEPFDDYMDRLPAGGGARRTVVITGRGSERQLQGWQSTARRRPPKRAYERAGSRPDRIAMWAVLMGVLLVLVAVTSSHAALPIRHVGAGRAVTAVHAGAARSQSVRAALRP